MYSDWNPKKRCVCVVSGIKLIHVFHSIRYNLNSFASIKAKFFLPEGNNPHVKYFQPERNYESFLRRK
jgi:hypothetical protein